MSFRYPGYLNAKSLSEGGDCREDYVEWFSNPLLSPYRPLINAVYRAMQYRGEDPVLLVYGVSAEACLLFRFTMKSQDRKGRNHQRCEVMMVEQSELPALLNGEFRAVPDEESKEFVVDRVEGAVLSQCECHRVKDEVFSVYTRNQRAYWFKGEESSPPLSPRQQTSSKKHPAGDSIRTIRPIQTVDHSKKGEKNMCRVLLALLIVVCVLGGWNYFQSMSKIEQMGKKVQQMCEDMEDMKKMNKKQMNKIEQLCINLSTFESETKKSNVRRNEEISGLRSEISILTNRLNGLEMERKTHNSSTASEENSGTVDKKKEGKEGRTFFGIPMSGMRHW